MPYFGMRKNFESLCTPKPLSSQFLSNYDIDHIFFDSFYEGKNTKIYDDFAFL